MEKRTSTGNSMDVGQGGSLAMTDCRVFGGEATTSERAGAAPHEGGYRTGVMSWGYVKLTRCTVENNPLRGVYIYEDLASAELVDCVIRKIGDGVVSVGSKVVLRGGTIRENKRHDVSVGASDDETMVTVAPAEEGKPQTISKGNEGCDWHMYHGGEIIGIPHEKINV